MTELRQVSAEVFVASQDHFHLIRHDLERLKQFALASPRGRARICAHKHVDETLHEMMIVLSRQSYVRPHRHWGKSESLHLLEGELDFLLFGDSGELEQRLELGPFASGKPFYHHLSTPKYHSLLVRSELAVLHETTQGPFDPNHTEQAAWAPAESAVAEGLAWLSGLQLSAIGTK